MTKSYLGSYGRLICGERVVEVTSWRLDPINPYSILTEFEDWFEWWRVYLSG